MTRYRLKMKSPEDVRKSLSRVSNMLINGEIDPKTANAIIYAGNSVLQSIRVDVQEKKIEKLEEMLNQLNDDD